MGYAINVVDVGCVCQEIASILGYWFTCVIPFWRRRRAFRRDGSRQKERAEVTWCVIRCATALGPLGPMLSHDMPREVVRFAQVGARRRTTACGLSSGGVRV